MKIGIDKNVPLPKATSGRGNTIYPFDEMEVGDSFFRAGTSAGKSSTVHKKRNPGRNYTSRAVVEDGVKGERVCGGRHDQRREDGMMVDADKLGLILGLRHDRTDFVVLDRVNHSAQWLLRQSIEQRMEEHRKQKTFRAFGQEATSVYKHVWFVPVEIPT